MMTTETGRVPLYPSRQIGSSPRGSPSVVQLKSAAITAAPHERRVEDHPEGVPLASLDNGLTTARRHHARMAADSSSPVLESWKQIAAYLKENRKD